MEQGRTETQFVTFALGAEIFATPVAVVREILDQAPAFRIPNGPDYFLGLRNVRGQGVPVIDLRMRLGLSRTEATAQTRVLVVDVPVSERTLTLGIVAERVFEVASFRHDRIEPAPDIGVRWDSSYIEGVVRQDDGFVVIVNLADLLSEGDVAALAAARAQERAA
jgi:purine-binding chemotaxis protein CheW